MAEKTRVEKDSLGEVQVPAQALYGVQTQRGVENWRISGQREPEVFIKAYVLIKKSAALINHELGMLEKEKTDAIVKASDEILSKGKHLDEFVIDIYQAGAGTSFNMNTNEVLSNLAAQLEGKSLGTYDFVHPNDDVNKAQSTNDSFPTAIKISTMQEHQRLMPVLEKSIQIFDQKAKDFDGILKSARTHLQDAVPLRLGQEFSAFADSLRKEKTRLEFLSQELKYLNIGATAAGTGMNSHPDYAAKVVAKISELTGIDFKVPRNHVEIAPNMSDAAAYSAGLRNLALTLTKIANDLRLLSSGPTTGLAEISLPAVQPGSSIMPGKVNPVVMEMLNQVCFEVIGNDTTVSYSTQAGQLQLNVMMPVISYNLLSSLKILRNALDVSNESCFNGITPNEERCKKYFSESMGLATALNTVVGYEKAADVVKKAVKENRGIIECVIESGHLTEDEVKEYFGENLTRPGFIKK